ncbi:protein kinase [Xylophilus rhododendri]|uniref:Protein kinase n=1 Tax=Xylophilus rhododendri TaxID=2697032 RepID=A0A857J1N1_9BURK|nr:protein kinase [Xylophilus rhododendri]QHI96992.1 protein kinase [Xylophilus rhododendri]
MEAQDTTHARLLAGELKGLKRLDLSCGLTGFPPEIFELADSLEVLNLSGNQLSELPHDLHRLHRLQVLFCSGNRFTELPTALGACTSLETVGFKSNSIRQVDARALPASLRWLILTDNRIEELPAELGQRPRLQKLMLAGNRLRALPPSLAHCLQLELIRIAANPLESLPDWLTALPRLAWIACAGTPCAPDLGSPALPEIAWDRLTLEAVLGEGASGVIHQAQQRHGDGPRPVAVKIFKGAVTSDGWPADEMAACMAAGLHPQLVGAQGRIAGHPQRRQGLVMPLVDSSFQVLAGPPSLASCTRDVYPERAAFSPATALRIALDIARAVAHLHQRGILHGDLYAHNILVGPEGAALLGDFGAASRFSTEAGATRSTTLQRLEARAFGCLLEELCQRCDAPATDPALQTLVALRDRCLHEQVDTRPSFAELVQTLAVASQALSAGGSARGQARTVQRELQPETGAGRR